MRETVLLSCTCRIVIMRVFSNTLIEWPEIYHVFQSAKLNLEPWQNYYFYRIRKVHPLILSTHSDLTLLKPSRQFYSYIQYELTTFGGPLITCRRKIQDTRVYIPSCICVNDVIVIRDD